jgi:hypothetical protein
VLGLALGRACLKVHDGSAGGAASADEAERSTQH